MNDLDQFCAVVEELAAKIQKERELGAAVLFAKLIDLFKQQQERGWNLAHEPAKCGHARANYKDPDFGTPDYGGNEKCEVCELLEQSIPVAEVREMLKAATVRADATYGEHLTGPSREEIANAILK